MKRRPWLIVTALIAVVCGSLRASAEGDYPGGYDPDLFSKMKWRNIGPSRGGRSVAVAGVPGDPLTYYMGGTGGGVWKTTDAGLTWHAISDKFFKTGSVGAIAVAPSDHNVLYVGMGEACVRGNFSHGDGVYKSVDAGKTWEHVGLDDTRQIGAVVVHPRDADIVYVAALGHVFGTNEQRGVFRSTDGGKTWKRVLFVDEQTGCVDLSLDVTNPRVLYAGMWQVNRTPYALNSGGEGSGLYKTSDGGDNWTELTKGIPEGIKGRIGVAVSPVKPERVWALIEAKEGGVFRSDDAGESFKRINEDRRWRQRAWYYTHIYADTQSADTVYVLNTALAKSTDGGKTYSTIRVPHGDNHDLWIAPEDNRRLINANDGGANVSLNGGESWSRQDNLPTAQFYHVTTDNQFPYRVYGSQQDNSSITVSSRNRLGNWQRDAYSVGGGESGYIAVRPDNPNIIYAGSYGGYLSRYDHQTQQMRNVTVWPENPMGWGAAALKVRFQWTFPILVSQHDPDTIYAAGNILFKSTNQGKSWTPISPDLTRDEKSMQGPSGGPITHDNTAVEYYCTIFAVAESPHERGVIWTGSDDGLVHLTRDGGKTWQNVTPAGLPEWNMISQIDVSPHDAATCYVAANRYKLDDFKPYIYKTDDYGKSWKGIVSGIADDAFVRAVREDPAQRGLLYAGTETGVYVSFDDGSHWQSLQLELPVVPITDMVVKEGDLVVATQGRSFWILDDLTQLHQLNAEVASADVHLFKPDATTKNVDRGVTINYFLREEPKTIKLDLLDASGKLIKSFEKKQADKKDEKEETPRRRFGGGAKYITAEKGMNQFVWDTRYADASEVKGAILWGGSTRGPASPPGTYRARLTVGDDSCEQSFKIHGDPRSVATQADYDEQFALLLKIRDRLTETDDAINHIREIKRQARAAAERVKRVGDNEAVGEATKALVKKLTAVEEELIQTRSKSNQDPLNFPIKLNNKIAALAGVVGQSNAAPTKQMIAVFDDLKTRLRKQLDKLDAIVETDVPAFNALIREQDLPAIQPEQK